MKIHWDMKIYDGLPPETRKLCDEAKLWILNHKDLSSKYVSIIQEGNPAPWFSRVMTNVEIGIDNKEIEAVDLGCHYVINAKKAPFGKIHKSNILVRLKRNSELIKQKFIPQLTETLCHLKKMKHPPREVRELEKLLKTICITTRSTRTR